MNTREIEGKKLSEVHVDGVVVICHFVEGEPVPQNPAVHFQVTVRKESIAPAGRFIRFDGSKGDEIHGWQRMDFIVIDEVLGKLSEDGKTVEVVEREPADVIAIERSA